MSLRRLLALAGLLALAALQVPPPAVSRGTEAPKPPRWTSAYGKSFEALVERYAKAGDDRTKDDVLAEAGKLGPFPAAKRGMLEKIVLAAARRGPKSDGSGTCTLHAEGFENATYILTGAGNGKGIWLGLHGGGHGSGDGRSAASLWGSATGKGLMGVFPTTPRKTPRAWNTELGERFLLAILRELKRTYRLDTNRVYVGGHSMGGEGAWNIGGRYADQIAAATANAGGPDGVYAADQKRYFLGGGVLANMANTPVWFFHSVDDDRTSVLPDQEAARFLAAMEKKYPRHYRHVWREYRDIGHGMPPKGVGPIIQWVTRHKRDPWPELLVWEPSRPWYRTFSWLRLRRTPFRAHGHGNRIVARRKGNRFDVEAGIGIEDVSLLLPATLVDARKPVVVARNGEVVFEGFVLPDPRAVIETGWERLDPETIATYRIDLPDRR